MLKSVFYVIVVFYISQNISDQLSCCQILKNNYAPWGLSVYLRCNSPEIPGSKLCLVINECYSVFAVFLLHC